MSNRSVKEVMTGYYKYQLEKICTNDTYPATIQIKDGINKTHCLDLNNESANEMIKWLKSRFKTGY